MLIFIANRVRQFGNNTDENYDKNYYFPDNNESYQYEKIPKYLLPDKILDTEIASLSNKKFRTLYLNKKFNNYFQKKRVILDIGCGTAGLLKYFNKLGHITYGNEPNKNYYRFAKKFLKYGIWTFQKCPNRYVW